MSTRWWRPALLTLLSLGALHAERSRPAVRTSGGPRRAKRTQPPKRLEVHAFAADSPGVELREHDYEEAMALAPDSVDVQVHACSLGAADVQQLRGEWGPCVMPLVPGRDAVGVVVGVGSAVKGLARGQRVAVLLGTGTDAENDADGADRGADSMTAGALAHHVRVPARWAFPVPAALPTAHVAGLLSVGGPIWAQLMSARLDKGAKLAVVGGGTAGALALSLGSALGLNVYEMGAAPVAALPEGSSKAAKRAHKKRLDATDEETGRLHGASFDAVLCVCGDAPLALDAFLPYAKPESSILLAGCAAKELVASPRTLQERRLSVVGAGATSAKERQRLLAFCAQHRVRLAQEASELDAPSACAALAAIEAEPEARKVLVRSALISSWMRANRTGTAVNAAPSADGLVQTGLASVFGVFNKVAEETKNAAKYAREGVSSTAAKLVEQVEEESKRELEQRHGSLSGFDVDVPADGGDDEEEDEDEGEGDGEEEDEDDDEYDDEDEDGEDDDEDDDDDDEEEEDDDEEDDDEEDADDDFDDEEEDEEDGGDDDDDDDDDDDEEED